MSLWGSQASFAVGAAAGVVLLHLSPLILLAPVNWPGHGLLKAKAEVQKGSGNTQGPLRPGLRNGTRSLLPKCHWPKQVTWPGPNSKVEKHTAHYEVMASVWMQGAVSNGANSVICHWTTLIHFPPCS